MPSLLIKNWPFSAVSHSFSAVKTLVVTAWVITFFLPVLIVLWELGNPIAFNILDSLTELNSWASEYPSRVVCPSSAKPVLPSLQPIDCNVWFWNNLNASIAVNVTIESAPSAKNLTGTESKNPRNIT